MGGKLVTTKSTHVELADTKAQYIRFVFSWNSTSTSTFFIFIYTHSLTLTSSISQRYTPSLPGQKAAVSDQRVIRMVEMQKDPMVSDKGDGKEN